MRTSRNNIMSCFLLLFGYQFEGTVPYLWKIRDRSVRNVILFRHHSKSLTFLVRADSIFSTVIGQFDLFFKSIVVVRVSNCLGSVSLSFYTSFECYEYLVRSVEIYFYQSVRPYFFLLFFIAHNT